MERNKLTSRIQTETGITVSGSKDRHLLSGVFNRYRPSGDGLGRIFLGEGVEKAVTTRLKRIFDATVQSWHPEDMYFVIRKHDPIDPRHMQELATKFLKGVYLLADFIGDRETCDVVASLSAVKKAEAKAKAILNEDTPVVIHECVTDFLAKFQPEKNEIFILKEAIYSMANDYFLMAYVLWPAIEESVPLHGVLDSYYDLWRHGVALEYSADGCVYVRDTCS